ncbi:translation initiation factor IF-2 [bacterium]|nr:translation initiation factor IF-2 [bacterium]|tara:strand:- start:1056 stop:3116 length:2061 start_codon:yes stop_codon:yes gene_type:complete
MVVKLKELAENLNSSIEELTGLLKKLEFDYDEEKLEVDEDIAELLEDEIGTTKSDIENIAENIEGSMDREIKKTARKKTAGKTKFVKKNHGNSSLKSESLDVSDSITVKEICEKTGVSPAKLIGELMKNGIIANINQSLDIDTAMVILPEFGIKVNRVSKTGSTDDLLSRDVDTLIGEEDAENLSERPPIITIMGHVDHGKTKLLDTIRNTNVVAGESGGITQHVAAYQITHNEKKITFIDTPGHEAFTEMRARGAKLTDIAILVVAATEGVKPTTIEAINHAKDAGVPIIVAINKMDLPEANPEKVKTELVEYGLQAEDWGGDTIMVPISALKGDGIDKLLDMILLVSEVENLKANPKRAAIATAVETHQEPGLGPVATVIVNTGTLRMGDIVVLGNSYGKVKAMLDDNGNRVSVAPPSFPVLIAGLSSTPLAGDVLQVCKNDKEAKDRANQISEIRTNERLASKAPLLEIVTKIAKGDLKVLKLIVKTDTKGSFDAIKGSLEKIKHEEVMVDIIHHAVGEVSQSDVAMAAAGQSIIVAFHTKTSSDVSKLAEQKGVEIRSYEIIYKLIEDITAFLSGMLDPEEVVTELGKAELRQIFFSKKNSYILGCKITNGVMKKGSTLRVIRDGETVGEAKLDSLRKGDENVPELKAGNECGLKVNFKDSFHEGDLLEAYEVSFVERKLEV